MRRCLLFGDRRTGSGYGADLFRRHCGDVVLRIGYANNNSQLASKGKLDEEELHIYPWLGVQHKEKCARFPHGHGSLDMYRRGGLEKFKTCTRHAAPVRLFTILRSPIEKFLSAIYFWKQANPFREKLAQPETLSTEDIDNLVRAVFGYSNEVVAAGMTEATTLAHNNGERFTAFDRFAPTPEAGHLLQYTHTLGRVEGSGSTDAKSGKGSLQHRNQESPVKVAVQRACEALRSPDFAVVGLTERMDEFVVLVALENRWPLEEMCAFASHVNTNRPKRESLPAMVVAHLENLLGPDLEVYDCAVRVADAQRKRAARLPGRNFSKALKIFQSDPFRERCAEIRKENARVLGRKNGKARRHFEMWGNCISSNWQS